MSQVQTRDRADRLFLEVGQERGYLTPDQIARIQAEMETSGRSAEQCVERLQILSRRRVQRLLNHVRFKSLRQCDKVYARAAVKAGLIREADAEWALRTQRERFEQGRERLRVGSLLVERKLLRPEQDRELAARITQEIARSEAASGSGSAGSGSGSAGSGSGIGIREHDSSLPNQPALETTPVRAVQRDTRARAGGPSGLTRAKASRSRPIPAPVAPAPVEEPPAALMDSAEAFERACIQLARRRIEGPSTRESGSKLSR